MPRDLSFDHVIDFAADLVRIPGAPGAEGDVARRVVHELESLGFDDVWTDEVGNAIGRVKGGGGAPVVMVSSHLDVVDPGDPETWEYHPYGGALAGGCLHGRGAMDIKGPLAVQTYAVARFLDERPEGDLVVAHTVLEERGGWGMEHILDRGELRPHALIIGEATGGDVCIGHRGRAELQIELRGVAGHASAPADARNSLDLLPEVLRALHDFAELLPADDVLGPSTLAPTGIMTAPASPNVIPDLTRVTVDWRVLPGWTPERVLEEARAFLESKVEVPDGYGMHVRFARESQSTYTGLRRERELYTPGFLLPPDHPVPRAAARAVREATATEPRVRPWRFATDGGHACGVHGIPAIGYAPGEERHAHTNRERLELDAARLAYQAYPAVIRAVQESLQ